MRKVGALFGAALVSAALFLCPIAAGEGVPLLEDLRPEPEVTTTTEEGPVLPAAVNPASAITDIMRLCPTGAVWYLGVPDAKRLSESWKASSLGQFQNEPAFRNMLRNNRFGLEFLFSDLPLTAMVPERIRAASAMFDLAEALADNATSMAMSAYFDNDGNLSFLFLLDIGLERIPSFDIMSEWETSFFVTNSGVEATRGNHAGNFIDVWRLKNQSDLKIPALVAAGFAENIAIVSNDANLAAAASGLLSGGESLSDSHWGIRLADSNAPNADAVGFVRMETLLAGLSANPIAKRLIAQVADFIGSGGHEGEAIYYGLQFASDGARETFLLPLTDGNGAVSLIELVAKRLRSTESWITPTVIPYQPTPMAFVSGMFDGKQLGALLRQDRRLFGLEESDEVFAIPPSIRKLITPELSNLFTGEIGFALFPAPNPSEATPTPKSPWMLILPCSGDPTSLLVRAATETERGRAVIYSDDSSWREAPSWTVLAPGMSRRLSSHFLVASSTGDLVVSTIDQLAVASSFSDNRDFRRAMSQAEANQGMIFYLNMPEILVRAYPNLSSLMRAFYPRSSGFNSRPPLAMLRKYNKGLMAVIAPADSADEFTRMTIQAPLPAVGMLAARSLLSFPLTLRMTGRLAMEKSRQNLQALWLQLQLYSSRYGHFPESLNDLSTEMRQTMTNDEIRDIFSAPAALVRMSPADAARDSYRYLSGVTPADEPDLPIIYESDAWNEDFAGMYPTMENRAPSETGNFISFRQFVRLDGTVVVVPEVRFQDRVAPRLQERE